MRCSKCGFEMKKEDVFCANCGTKKTTKSIAVKVVSKKGTFKTTKETIDKTLREQKAEAISAKVAVVAEIEKSTHSTEQSVKNEDIVSVNDLQPLKEFKKSEAAPLQSKIQSNGEQVVKENKKTSAKGNGSSKKDTYKKGNSNKKALKIAALVTAICAVVAIVIVLIVIFIPNKKSPLCEQAEELTAKFFDAYISEEETAIDYLSVSFMEEGNEYGEYQSACAKKLTYKIIESTEIDEKTCKVTLEVKNISIVKVLEELEKADLTDEEEIIDEFNDLIEDAEADTVYKFDVLCKEYPTGMKILLNEQMSDAMLGGLSSYVLEGVE